MESHEPRESLAASFDHHVEEEGRILAQYRALGEALGSDSPIGFLVDLILTEEELHHLLLRTMAKWLRAPPVPNEGAGTKGVAREELLEQTRRLREHERETIDACRSVKDRLGERDRELFDALVDAVALDSEKHQRLLRAVETLLGA